MKQARSPSTKPSTCPRVQAGDTLGLLEAVNDTCLNIETLAGLLAAIGLRGGTDLIEVRLVANTAALISEETRRLQKFVAALHARMVNGAAVR